MKVLVIDDEPQIRHALKIGLERNGYDVQLAGTGEEGLDKMAVEMPELVVLDLAMPDETNGRALHAVERELETGGARVQDEEGGHFRVRRRATDQSRDADPWTRGIPSSSCPSP